MSKKLIRLSVNAEIIDKNIHNNIRAFSEGWNPVQLTIKQLAKHINLGHAFSAQFKHEIRKGLNFDGADFVAVDVDGTLSLKDARKHEFISKYGSLLYTTPSHGKDGKDRFRVVFVTPTTIKQARMWSNAMVGLASTIGGDFSSTDAARLFYGSRNSHPEILGKALSSEALKQLVKLGRQNRPKSAFRDDDQHLALANASERSPQVFDEALQLRQSDGRVGTINELPEKTSVFCPFHADDTPSAFTVKSKNGVPGLHCSACRRTFWPANSSSPQYDFYQFDKIVHRTAKEQLAAVDSAGSLTPRKKYSMEASVLCSRYLPHLPVMTGTVLVKSPKGSGKTARIEDIVNDARRNKQSVLLIGHRRTLLSDLARRLTLQCYLDDKFPRDYMTFDGIKWATVRPPRPDFYAVSVDSLPIRLKRPRHYDIVIVDECEQVFSHVCAPTIRNLSMALKLLQHYVSSSPTIYLFDADLNDLSP